MLILSDENFKKEIQSAGKPVLVDFWSASCIPCLMLAQVLEKLSQEAAYQDKVVFAKINIDQSPLMAQEYQVDRIPMVLLFKENKAAAGFIGAQSENVIREFLSKNLNGKNN
ncbi:MAG: hypothetical protein A2896_00545 [Candidatus Nealsonbacteria bacterium RIFCSPLOWO2_01_FULL_43_32]|uniref:Thioredoxin n=1 Tax=Candidatus Nealsonbacteria bacterium RIFCSPLOWO2_01_FULL_43_32 TaxID=1801672 RepID=A0A1G2EH58_9BACT|nr:MAG: hypothetical protein A2896_00545 [Candidatus Nealsonbacteria bacterium RIFCSPLOWO2_01_FULL_43_32]